MVKRYFRIEESIRKIKELDSYLPSPSDRRSLEESLEHFRNFSSITVCLQKKGLLLNDARQIFDHVCEDYPGMSGYLSVEASIVHDGLFEKAMVKVMSGHENQLNSVERNIISDLCLGPIENNSTDSSSNMSYYERIEAKRRRLSSSSTKYINCKFIPATSCSVERLFSAARWILTCLRKRMSPILFESLLFLKLNRRLWDLKLVSSAIKIQPKERYIELDHDDFYIE